VHRGVSSADAQPPVDDDSKPAQRLPKPPPEFEGFGHPSKETTTGNPEGIDRKYPARNSPRKVAGNRPGLIHKMCGKLCENQFFDRSNSLKSDCLLPVCLIDVQVDESRSARIDAHIKEGTKNPAAKTEATNRKRSLRNDKMQPFLPEERGYRPSTSAT